MPQQNVLRALCHCKLDGETGLQLIPAIKKDDCYRLVLKWASIPDKSGAPPESHLVTPSKWVDRSSHDFRVITDPSIAWELEGKSFIDFDAMEFPAQELSPSEVFSNPENLY